MRQKEADKDKIGLAQEKEAPELPVSDEQKEPKGKDRGESQGEKKKEEPRDDESWVV